MKSHNIDNYKKLSKNAMDRNPKAQYLTDARKEELIEENSRICSCLHSEWQMLRACEQFHHDVFQEMVGLYQTVKLDKDASFRKLRQLLHECDLCIAKSDMVMDDIYTLYTDKLFPYKTEVAIDDTKCYGVLYDILTTAFGCDKLGDVKDSEYEIIRVRKSYLNKFMDADPNASNNIIRENI